MIDLAPMFGTIGILTGGGDAPGLNAVIRAVVKTATCEYGMRVIGIEDDDNIPIGFFESMIDITRFGMFVTQASDIICPQCSCC